MYKCLRYPVIGTYRSLLWVVLRNKRILRDQRNLINVVFVLAFLCSLAVYIPLLSLMSWLILLLSLLLLLVYLILLVDIKELRVETHRIRTHQKFLQNFGALMTLNVGITL